MRYKKRTLLSSGRPASRLIEKLRKMSVRLSVRRNRATLVTKQKNINHNISI
jgi:hypothetical protein